MSNNMKFTRGRDGTLTASDGINLAIFRNNNISADKEIIEKLCQMKASNESVQDYVNRMAKK